MRAAVIACALASAGCELVFPAQGGGDDGDDGDDVEPPPDAGPAWCSTVADPGVIVCADFDSDDTGLRPVVLEAIISPGGSVAPVGPLEPPFAPSPPNVLLTTQAALPGPGSSWAQAIHVGPTRWSGAIDVWVRAPQPESADCVPVVLGVGLMTASVKIQAFGGGYRILVQSNQTVVDFSSSLPVDLREWNRLHLAVDLPAGLVELSMNQGTVTTLAAQGVLAAESAAQATIVAGVAMLRPHGDCGYLFDNLVVSTVK